MKHFAVWKYCMNIRLYQVKVTFGYKIQQTKKVMSAAPCSRQIYWFYNRKVALKIDIIFLSYNQTGYPTDTKYNLIHLNLISSFLGNRESFKHCYLEMLINFALIHFHFVMDRWPFLTRELRACARASCRYDVGNSTRSLARSIGRFL